MKFRSRAMQAVYESHLNHELSEFAATALQWGTDDGRNVFPGHRIMARDLRIGEREVRERWRLLTKTLGVFRDEGYVRTERGFTVRSYALDFEALKRVPVDTSARDARQSAARKREARPEIREARQRQGEALRRAALERRGAPALEFEPPAQPCPPGTAVLLPPAQPCPDPRHSGAITPGTAVPPSRSIGTVDRSKEGSSDAADAAPPPPVLKAKTLKPKSTAFAAVVNEGRQQQHVG